jgi:hypothetical protein
MASTSMHHPTTHVAHRAEPMTLASISEGAAYWLSLFGVYLSVGYMMWSGAAEKLFVGNIAMPAPLAKTFGATWLGSLVGVDLLWATLGAIELVIGLVMLASLVRGEFLPSRSKLLLQVSLAMSLALFGIFVFGQSVVGNFAGTLSAFTYLGLTILVMALVANLPPNRGPHWLEREEQEAVDEAPGPE